MSRVTPMTRNLTRETKTLYRGRPLVVTLSGRCMYLYPKGLPAACYAIAYDQAYEAAGKLAARSKLAVDSRQTKG